MSCTISYYILSLFLHVLSMGLNPWRQNWKTLIKAFSYQKVLCIFVCIFSIYNYDFVIVTMINLLQSSCIVLNKFLVLGLKDLK